ncbi:MAG: hypothetical protein GXY82_00090 [Methanospirillum sp.]|nr:hypothetical protein [Methanospirillum sp.]
MAPDPSWVWIAPALLLAVILEYVLQQISIGRWDRMVPVLLVLAASLALSVVHPEGKEGWGVLLLAVIVAFTALVPLPVFSYALDHMSRLVAALIATAVSLAVIFLLSPGPETGLGWSLAGALGIQGAAAWPFAGLGLFVYGLFTAGIGYALALFIDEIADRMSSVFSGFVFGAILLLLGLGLGEAVVGGLLAFALLQYIRIVPDKGIHMLLIFPAIAIALAVSAFTQAHPEVVGSEAFVLPVLVPAVAVITPFVLLEPQVLTRREGIGVVLAGLIALPVISLVITRSPTVEGLNAFGPLHAAPMAFDPALVQWGILYLEVVLISLAFYLIVVMGLAALRRPSRQF